MYLRNSVMRLSRVAATSRIAATELTVSAQPKRSDTFEGQFVHLTLDSYLPITALRYQRPCSRILRCGPTHFSTASPPLNRPPRRTLTISSQYLQRSRKKSRVRNYFKSKFQNMDLRQLILRGRGDLFGGRADRKPQSRAPLCLRLLRRCTSE